MSWVEGHWWFEPSLRALQHIPSGNYEDGVIPDVDISLSTRLIPSLVEAAQEYGLVPVRHTTRAEDLKIIHRLLDVVEKAHG